VIRFTFQWHKLGKKTLWHWRELGKKNLVRVRVPRVVTQVDGFAASSVPETAVSTVRSHKSCDVVRDRYVAAWRVVLTPDVNRRVSTILNRFREQNLVRVDNLFPSASDANAALSGVIYAIAGDHVTV
jgi:hypothetical protein